MDTQWQRCLASLRRYRLRDPDDMKTELRRAHREASARARCVLHLICYVAAGIVIMAWATGLRDWMTAEISRNPAWGALTLIAVTAALVAWSAQYRPPSDASIEARVRWRYAPADTRSFQDIEPLLEGCREVRDIVAGWLLVLPTLRNVEVEQLRAVMAVWEASGRQDAEVGLQPVRGRAVHGV